MTTEQNQEQQIIKLYVDERMSIDEVREQVKRDRLYVYRVLKEAGVLRSEGKPLIGDEPLQPITVRLSESMIEFLDEQPEGRSDAVRQALDQWRLKRLKKGK